MISRFRSLRRFSMVDLIAARTSVPPKSAIIPSQYLWASANDWKEYGRDLSQRKEWWEPKEHMLKLTSTGRDLRKTEREDFKGATREDMLPERSTMNTTSGFAVFGRLNLGTRVTMRAFELGLVGWTSSRAAGEERLAHL